MAKAISRTTGIVAVDVDDVRHIDQFKTLRGSTWTRQLAHVLQLWTDGMIDDEEFVCIGRFDGKFTATQTASRIRRRAMEMVPEITDPDGAPTEIEFEWVFRTVTGSTKNAVQGSELWVAIAAVGP